MEANCLHEILYNDNVRKYEQIFGDLGSAIVPLSNVIENVQYKDNFFI